MSQQDRVIYGALAGLVATMAMTAAMNRMSDRLPRRSRYPLPPREITERLAPAVPQRTLPAATTLAHFGFGALAGALHAATPARSLPGPFYGAAVWLASYWGWVPASGILLPAHRHPPERNALMLVAHLVWGAALSLSSRELERAVRGPFAGGPLSDARNRRIME
jgi:hypothetical protein